MAMTIKNIAKAANVSPTTVSLVLSNRGDELRISKNTRQKVLQVVRKTGYISNFHTRSILKQNTFTIGMVIADIAQPASAAIVEGAKAECIKSGYHVIFGVSSDNPEEERFYVNNFLARRVDAIVVIPTASGETLAELEKLYSEGFPLVLCEMPFVTGIDSITTDLSAGSYQAAKYLLENGHKRIAFCVGHHSWLPSKAKYQGYRSAMEEKGLQPQKELYITTELSDMKAGSQAASVFLQMRNKPDAILFGNDEMAVGALNTFVDAGVNIPEDISLVGYDDIQIAQAAKVKLTTVSSPLYEVGTKAVALAIEKIQSRKAKGSIKNISQTYQTLNLSPRLIIRDSTAPRK